MHDKFLDDENKTNMFAQYARHHLPQIDDYTGIDRYVYFWSAWNKRVEDKADKTFRIEDINKDPNLLFNYLQIPPREIPPKDTNSYGEVEQIEIKTKLPTTYITKHYG